MMPRREAHLRRWHVAAAFVSITIAMTIGLWKVQRDSASIRELQRTNCSLVEFLRTARHLRLAAAATETGERRRADLAAAKGYGDLAARFRGGAIGKDCRATATLPVTSDR